MNFHPSFWLISLAAFTIPLGVTQGCHQQSTPVSGTSAATSGTTIHASSKPTGITITGVN